VRRPSMVSRAVIEAAMSSPHRRRKRQFRP
jgi:hypothetical protein